MAAFPPYITPLGRIWHYAFRIFCGAVLLFLIAPILRNLFIQLCETTHLICQTLSWKYPE